MQQPIAKDSGTKRLSKRAIRQRSETGRLPGPGKLEDTTHAESGSRANTSDFILQNATRKSHRTKASKHHP